MKAGDRVVTVGLDGSHAELRAVGEPFCWVIPEGVTTEEGACVPVPFGTADDCLFEFGRLQAGETALIHAGASGVGIAAIQMAKRAGARVLATASSDEPARPAATTSGSTTASTTPRSTSPTRCAG